MAQILGTTDQGWILVAVPSTKYNIQRLAQLVTNQTGIRMLDAQRQALGPASASPPAIVQRLPVVWNVEVSSDAMAIFQRLLKRCRII